MIDNDRQQRTREKETQKSNVYHPSPHLAPLYPHSAGLWRGGRPGGGHTRCRLRGLHRRLHHGSAGRPRLLLRRSAQGERLSVTQSLNQSINQSLADTIVIFSPFLICEQASDVLLSTFPNVITITIIIIIIIIIILLSIFVFHVLRTHLHLSNPTSTGPASTTRWTPSASTPSEVSSAASSQG